MCGLNHKYSECEVSHWGTVFHFNINKNFSLLSSFVILIIIIIFIHIICMESLLYFLFILIIFFKLKLLFLYIIVAANSHNAFIIIIKYNFLFFLSFFPLSRKFQILFVSFSFCETTTVRKI